MTTMAESEWDEDMRSLVVAERAYTDRLCPLCGRPESVCQDPARQFDWHVPAPVRCHATTAVLAKQDAYSEESNPQFRALLFHAVLADEGATSG